MAESARLARGVIAADGCRPWNRVSSTLAGRLSPLRALPCRRYTPTSGPPSGCRWPFPARASFGPVWSCLAYFATVLPDRGLPRTASWAAIAALGLIAAEHAKRCVEADRWRGRERPARGPARVLDLLGPRPANGAADRAGGGPTAPPRSGHGLPTFADFVTIDPFHSRVIVLGPELRPGVALALEHRAFGLKFLRFGRLLSWREGRGYTFSDLSGRGGARGFFPHVFDFAVEPAATEAGAAPAWWWGSGASGPRAVSRDGSGSCGSASFAGSTPGCSRPHWSLRRHSRCPRSRRAHVTASAATPGWGAHPLDDQGPSKCPRCGLPYVPDKPETYANRPRPLQWNLWVPGLFIAILAGVLAYARTLKRGGARLHRLHRRTVRRRAHPGLYDARQVLDDVHAQPFRDHVRRVPACLDEPLGAFCGAILGAIFLGPATGRGRLVGWLIRRLARRAAWDRRRYVFLTLFVGLPFGAGEVEARLPFARPIAEVSTSATFDAPVDAAWDAIVFYEQVEHGRPCS